MQEQLKQLELRMKEQRSQIALRLILSGVVMFFFFGLIPALPPIYFSMPGVRHMMTLHLEATANGIMLIVIGVLVELDFIAVSNFMKHIMEVNINLGAWFNVLPWLYGAYTGAVLQLHEKQTITYNHEKPLNNDDLVFPIIVCLNICMVGDIIAFTIILIGVIKRILRKSPLNLKKKN